MRASYRVERDSICEESIVPSDVALSRWYALRTRSRHERLVRDRLTGLGMEPFLPLQKVKRQWSDRKVVTELPLFQGYCFARFALVDRMTILQMPGVAGIVGAVVPEAIPDALRVRRPIWALGQRPIIRVAHRQTALGRYRARAVPAVVLLQTHHQ